MRKKSKFNLILIIFVIVLVLGLGYAFLTTTLSINGTTDVDSNTWNIYWDNVQVKEGSVSATTPTIDTNKTTVSFSVHLSKPGDFYEFNVDAKNDGTIDAMIDTITKTINNQSISDIPDYLDFKLTYSDGATIEEKQLLKASEKETYKIHIGYRTDIDPDELPTTNSTLTINIETTYVQADNSAKEARYYTYVFNEGVFEKRCMGDLASTIDLRFDSYQEFTNTTSLVTVIRHRLEDGAIQGSAVGGTCNGKEFYLIGGDGGEAYEDNIRILNEIIGEEYCESIVGGSQTDYCCSREDYISSCVSTNGHVFIQDRDVSTCSIHGVGESNGNGCSFCRILD